LRSGRRVLEEDEPLRLVNRFPCQLSTISSLNDLRCRRRISNAANSRRWTIWIQGEQLAAHRLLGLWRVFPAICQYQEWFPCLSHCLPDAYINQHPFRFSTSSTLQVSEAIPSTPQNPSTINLLQKIQDEVHHIDCLDPQPRSCYYRSANSPGSLVHACLLL
jgi:hypothetical protein